MTLKDFERYICKRLSERTTWLGLGAAATSLIAIDVPGAATAAAVFGAIAMVIPESTVEKAAGVVTGILPSTNATA